MTAADIAEALAAKGFEIDRRKLQLAEPIKRIGDVDVPVKLHRDVTATVKVKVVAEGSTGRTATNSDSEGRARAFSSVTSEF